MGEPTTEPCVSIPKSEFDLLNRYKEKWIALRDHIDKFYSNDESDDFGDLGDIGEVAASAFGYL